MGPDFARRNVNELYHETAVLIMFEICPASFLVLEQVHPNIVFFQFEMNGNIIILIFI